MQSLSHLQRGYCSWNQSWASHTGVVSVLQTPVINPCAPAPSCSYWLHSHRLALIPLLRPGQKEKQKPRRELSVTQSETQDSLPRTILVARSGRRPQGILMAELSGHQASGGFLTRNRPLVDPDQRQGRKQREEERRREMRERRQKTKRCKKRHTRKGSRDVQEL